MKKKQATLGLLDELFLALDRNLLFLAEQKTNPTAVKVYKKSLKKILFRALSASAVAGLALGLLSIAVGPEAPKPVVIDEK